MKFAINTISFDRDYTPPKIDEGVFATRHFPDMETAQRVCKEDSTCWAILKPILYSEYKEAWRKHLWEGVPLPETILTSDELQLLRSGL